MEGIDFSFKSTAPVLEVLRDVICEIPKLNNWWIKLSLGVQCIFSEYQVKNYILK